MAKTLSGLFTGPSAADVRMAMGLESDARIRQAGEDAKAGGFIPSYIARARQKGVEALQPLMGAGIQFFGGEVPQDPRLAKALKRDKDKKFIIDELGKLAGEDKQWNEDEMMRGYKLLMERGYPEEARKFLADAKMMADIEYIKNVKGQSKLTGQGGGLKSSQLLDVFIDTTTNKRYRAVLYNYKDGTNKRFILDDLGREIDPKNISEKIMSADRKGMTSIGRVDEELRKEENKLTVQEKEEWNKEKFTEISKAPGYGRNMEQADRLLGLLETIKSTGELQDNILTLKEFFGVAPASMTEFDSKTREYVTTQLQMMGRNPTDFDLKFLLRVNPGMLKSKAGNIRLLTLLKEHNRRKYEMARELNSGDFTRKRWYSKILVPSEKRLSQWHKKQKELFGKAAIPNPDTAKGNKGYKVIPNPNGPGLISVPIT